MSSPLWFQSPVVDATALAESLDRSARRDVVAVRSAIAPRPAADLPRVAALTYGVSVELAWARARRLADVGTEVTLVIEPGQLRERICGERPAALCVRLGTSAFEADEDALRSLADAPASLDGALLLLDVGQVHGIEAVDAIALAGMLSRIPDPGRWRGLIIAGGDPPSAASHQPRHLWSALRGLGPRLRRWTEVGVCDYGPLDRRARTFAYAGPTARQMFTWPSDDARRGHHRALAERVVEHRCFAGDSFSAGDAWIRGCAEGRVASPDSRSWRWAVWSHHVAQLTEDVAGLAASPWQVSSRDCL